MPYKIPKGIAHHPGVAECCPGVLGGAEKRHDVLLRPDWRFLNNSDHTRTGFFNSVQEFLDAQPERLQSDG